MRAQRSPMGKVDQLDFSDLTDKVSRAEVRAFRRDPANRALWAVAQQPENDLAAAIFRNTLPLLLLLGLDVVLIQTALTIKPLLTAVIFGAVAALFLWPTKLLIDPMVRMIAQGSLWERWLRLLRFADTNGLDYKVAIFSPAYAGTIFGRGVDRRAKDVVQFDSPTPVVIGNYRYGGEVEIGRVRQWGFIRLQLERALPNMVLESRTRHGLSRTRFPAAFANHQVLSLEGDFDRYFRLYVPAQYERDALYVLTPDLMALLIDEGAPFDIEIIDNWMNIYSHTAFSMKSPATYALLDRIMQTVAGKAVRQSSRYWDDRVADRTANIVAHRGRRLRQRANVLYAVAAGVIVLTMVVVLTIEAVVR